MGEAEGGETILVRSCPQSDADCEGGLPGAEAGQRGEGADASTLLEREVGHRREQRSLRCPALGNGEEGGAFNIKKEDRSSWLCHLDWSGPEC